MRGKTISNEQNADLSTRPLFLTEMSEQEKPNARNATNSAAAILEDIKVRRGRYEFLRPHRFATISFRRVEGAILQTHESGEQAICRLSP